MYSIYRTNADERDMRFINALKAQFKFHRFHRWLFTFNPFGVDTSTSIPNPNGVKRE
jgi:hypothetical protein